MNDKIKEIQDYLEEKGIKAPETAIVNAAIKIAMRGGGKRVFATELDPYGGRALAIHALLKAEGETK